MKELDIFIHVIYFRYLYTHKHRDSVSAFTFVAAAAAEAAFLQAKRSGQRTTPLTDQVLISRPGEGEEGVCRLVPRCSCCVKYVLCSHVKREVPVSFPKARKLPRHERSEKSNVHTCSIWGVQASFQLTITALESIKVTPIKWYLAPAIFTRSNIYTCLAHVNVALLPEGVSRVSLLNCYERRQEIWGVSLYEKDFQQESFFEAAYFHLTVD